MAVEQFERALNERFKNKQLYVDVKVVSEIFGLSEQTIYTYCKEGRFPSAIRGSKAGRGIRIPRWDIVEFHRRYMLKR